MSLPVEPGEYFLPAPTQVLEAFIYISDFVCLCDGILLTSGVDNEVVGGGSDGHGGDVANHLVGRRARAGIDFALGGLAVDVAKLGVSAVDEALGGLGGVDLAKRQDSLGLRLNGSSQGGRGSRQDGNSSEVHN